MDQCDVEADALAASAASTSAQARTTRSNSACRLAAPVRSRPQPEPELGGDLGQGRPFGGLVGRGDMRHGVGVDEGLRPVELVERPDQDLEPLPLGRARTTPRGQPDPVPEAPAQGEEIHFARRPEFLHRGVDGQLDVAQVGGDVLPPEQLVRQHPAAGEDLVGQLAPEHPPVGHAFARLLLGQAVEGSDPSGENKKR